MKMRNVIVVGGVLISLGLPACGSSNDNISPAQSVSPSVVRTKTSTPTVGGGGEDVSGNCDEPEHKSDATRQASGSGKSRSGSGDDNGGGGGSNSGPGY